MNKPAALIRTTLFATGMLFSGLVFSQGEVQQEARKLAPEDSQFAEEGPAQAYYRWLDGAGHIQYTDFEPVGVPSELIPLSPETANEDAPMLSSAGEDWQPDPFNDQDQQILPIEHIGPCADARRRFSVLHAAVPVYQDQQGAYRNAWRGDSYRGERSYLDAEARSRAIGQARRDVLAQCSDPDAFAREVDAFQKEVGAN